MLADRSTRSRLVDSVEQAEIALLELREEFADQLGYYYNFPRHFYLKSRPPQPRSGVTTRVRWLVFERDNFRCVYCGATAADDRLVVDHVLAVALGGTDDLDNLATSCETCNLGKGKRPAPTLALQETTA